MRNSLEVIGLEDQGVIRARGPDAVRFLQGQLSNDVSKLSAGQSLLAGYHNPQGRTIALLRLVLWEADDILAIVPRELAGSVSARIGKFVLRAKVTVTDESSTWRLTGVVGDTPPVAVTRAVSVPVGGSRWLMISPTETDPLPSATPADRATWERLEVAAGQPQVYAATSEEFVAQMLNLDAVNAIAFDKGCYTGQEVIARAHYRGRVKRRMQRFVSRGNCELKPGDSGQLVDGRTFKVVRAAQLADGRCDFLAVAPLPAALAEPPGPGESSAPRESPPSAESSTSNAPPVVAEASASGAAPIAADPAPVPYALPE